MNAIPPPAKMPHSPAPRDLDLAWNRTTRALVVVDVVESVRLMQADEADTIDRWRRFTAEVRLQVLPPHRGRLVKSLGDGLLLEFETVPAAIAAALSIQRAIPPYNLGRAEHEGMHLRVGVHVAEVVVDELDIYGSGVNLTARLAGLAEPGQVVASAQVRDQAVAGLDAEFEDMGACYLKHLEHPVQAYRVSPLQPLAAAPRAWPADNLQPTLAIIPFDVHDPEPAHQVLGELLADTLIARMAGSSHLRLISRLSTTALAGRGRATPEVGRLLGATFVVSGHIRPQGGRMAIHAELADAQSRQVIWAGPFHATVAELSADDAPLTEALCAELVRQMATRELRRVQHLPLPTLEGFSLQLSGAALMHRSTRQDFDRARDVLEHLVDRHPRAPEPRAWLAKWYVLRVTRNWVEDLAGESSRALDQTRRALDISPECSLALAMEGFVHCHMRRDLGASQAALEQALAVNPNSSLAWLFLCVVHGFRGEGRAAVAAADKAVALSPLDPLRHYYDCLACSAALAAGQLPKAIELAQRSLRGNRNHLPTLRALAIAQVESGEPALARETAAKILALDPGLTVQAYLARMPSGARSTPERYARALAEAGVPAS